MIGRRRAPVRSAIAVALVALIVPAAAQAQDGNGLPAGYEGPPMPVEPDIIARDAAGRTTIRAVGLTAPLRLDGALDEAIYASTPPMTDFVQTEPSHGSPATQRTEAWLFFDRQNVYVTTRVFESDPGRMVANEMRRDNNTIVQNEYICFIFDTFYDRRNGVWFLASPIGAIMDGQSFDNRQNNKDWNPIWDVAVGRFDGGWTMEAAIPFKSLRYRPGVGQVWGFNMQRFNRWKNEISALIQLPAGLANRSIWHVAEAPTVVGLEAPRGSRNLDVKPYALSTASRDVNADPADDIEANAGFDVKYGLTQNLAADFTYNTDFAQVEADEQQINLTRFSQFFPEKREFFLENQGLFAFGGASASAQTAGTDLTPIMFDSRRIGLNRGREVPIQAGGRLTGRIGPTSVGVLNIGTGDERVSGSRATNFSVVRLRRDLLRRSSIGAIATARSVGQIGDRSSQTYGVDGTFAFFDNLAVNTYWARTEAGAAGTSYRGQLDYAGDRYGVQLERLRVDDRFDPQVGFVRRRDLRRSFALFRFSPRPKSIRSVRRFSSIGSIGYIDNGTGRLETREAEGELAIEFENSDRLAVSYNDSYEYLVRPFAISSDVTIPVGGYHFGTIGIGFNFGQQRRASGNVLVEHGSFFGGHKTAISLARGRIGLTPQLSVEPTFSINRVDVPQGSFSANLAGSRVTFTMTPRMFASALMQYNTTSRSVSTNARLRWEYQPGSELFVVYNEERGALTRPLPELATRALVVKINRLFRF